MPMLRHAADDEGRVARVVGAVGRDERVGVLADRPAGVPPDPLARAMPLGVAFGAVAADDGLGRLLDEHGAARAGACECQTEDQPAGAEPPSREPPGIGTSRRQPNSRAARPSSTTRRRCVTSEPLPAVSAFVDIPARSELRGDRRVRSERHERFGGDRVPGDDVGLERPRHGCDVGTVPQLCPHPAPADPTAQCSDQLSTASGRGLAWGQMA